MMKTWLKKLLMLLLLAVLAFAVAVAETTDAAEDYVIIYFMDGAMVRIPASIANDDLALSDYCATYFPGRTYNLDASLLVPPDAVLSADWTSQLYGEGSRAMGVWMVTPGLYESLVRTEKGEMTVPTKYLTFDGNDDANHNVGVVHAPRTGEASLREKASGSAAKVAACKTGQIVVVLEYDGGTYTKIRYEGVEGYIRTDCLLFRKGGEAPLGTATLHSKGETDGEDTLTIRADMSGSAAKVDAWPTGTQVTVHEKSGDWYWIECDGWCGYIQKQYLTMNEN